MKRMIAVGLLAGLPLFAWAANVAPLGLEVGVVDLPAVQAKLKSQTRLIDVFIFGQDNKLDGVIMTLDKGRLKEVAAALRKKYRPVRENTPFVDDASALYRQGDSVACLEAPHLSFSMQVLYLSNRLQSAFEQGSSAEEAQRRRSQAEKF